MMYRHFNAVPRTRVSAVDAGLIALHRQTRPDCYSREISLRMMASIDALQSYPSMDEIYASVAEMLHVNRDNILITAGVDGAIKTIFEMCTKAGRRVHVLTPTYAMYEVYARAFECRLTSTTSDLDYRIDANAVLGSIDDSLDVLFLPNPHLPIEHTFTIEEVEAIAARCAESGALLFIDEAYFMFGAPTSIHLVHSYPNVVVARSFSKGFGLPAIRVGWMCGNADLIEYLSSKRLAYETSHLSNSVACWALKNISLFEAYVAEVTETRDWLRHAAQSLGLRVHGYNTNTLLVRTRHSNEASRLSAALEQQGFCIKRHIPTLGEDHIGFTVGSRTLMRPFFEVLMRELSPP